MRACLTSATCRSRRCIPEGSACSVIGSKGMAGGGGGDVGGGGGEWEWWSVTLPAEAGKDRSRTARAGARILHCLQAYTAISTSFWAAAPMAALTSSTEAKASAKSSMLSVPRERRADGALTPSAAASRELRVRTKVGPGLTKLPAEVRSAHSVMREGKSGTRVEAPASWPAPNVEVNARRSAPSPR